MSYNTRHVLITILTATNDLLVFLLIHELEMMEDSDIYSADHTWDMDQYYSYGVENQLGFMQTKENYVYSLKQVRAYLLFLGIN